MKDAFDFRDSLGEEALKSYITNLSKWGGHYLSDLWSTQLLAPDEMMLTMTNVQVPTQNSTVCGEIVSTLLDEYGVMVVGLSVDSDHGDIPCYLRLSAQVYIEEVERRIPPIPPFSFASFLLSLARSQTVRLQDARGPDQRDSQTTLSLAKSR
jgi:hypothetical protein